jgi:hypothetical protein
MIYGDDVNLLEGNISTINKIAATLIHSSKEVGPKVNKERQVKYMLTSRHDILTYRQLRSSLICGKVKIF